MAQIHQGDIGTIFRFEVRDENGTLVDLSVATTKEIIFLRPDGSTVTHQASLTTDGTDGQMEYTTVPGDLQQTGKWKRQGRIVLSAGDWRSSISEFEVHPNL